jgi:hypothetical protein
MGLINWKDDKPSWEPAPEPEFSDPLDYLDWFYKQADKPDRLRIQAAMELSRFRYPVLKAVAQVSRNDMASAIEAARLRSAAVSNVIAMKVVPKAIEALPAQHDASELRPSPGSADGTAFRRRF